MTSDIENIGKYIKDIAGDGKSFSILGYVTRVDEKKMVCEVKAAGSGMVYYNVRIKECTNESIIENGFWLIPALNSRVIIHCLAPSETYLSMVSEISKMHYRVDKKRVGFSKNGFSIDEEGGNDLKTLLDELFDLLSNKYKVQTAWGPSGPAMADTIQELNSLKDKFATLLAEGKDNAAQ